MLTPAPSRFLSTSNAYTAFSLHLNAYKAAFDGMISKIMPEILGY